jgi:hypothetical protein
MRAAPCAPVDDAPPPVARMRPGTKAPTLQWIEKRPWFSVADHPARTGFERQVGFAPGHRPLRRRTLLQSMPLLAAAADRQPLCPNPRRFRRVFQVDVRRLREAISWNRSWTARDTDCTSDFCSSGPAEPTALTSRDAQTS